MNHSHQPIISLHNVSFAFGQLPVLENITLDVEDGEFLGIVGPNAGGKSTVLKLILGLLEPQAGKIRVLGKNPQSNRHLLGYVSQYPSFPRDFPITVEQAVMLGRIGTGSRNTWLTALMPARTVSAMRLLENSRSDSARAAFLPRIN